MKLSRYIVRSPTMVDGHDRSILVLSTRSGRILRLPERVWEQISSDRSHELAVDALIELARARVLVPNDQDELAVLLGQRAKSVDDSSILALVVQPTAACQLGCDYCGQEHRSTLMSTPAQDAFVERAREKIRTDHKTLLISWFGAEPLLGLSVIRRLTPALQTLAHDAGLRYLSKVVTNGVALDADIAQELVLECGVAQFEITLDGIREEHDRRRIWKSGAPSYDRIMANVMALVDLGLPVDVTIRCNVDERNADHVESLIRELHNLGLHDKVGFYVAPVHSWGNDAHDRALSAFDYARRELEWFALQLELGFKIAPIPGRKDITCMATSRDDELVDPDGTVFNCTEVSLMPQYGTPNLYSLGSLAEGVDDEKRSRIGDFDRRVAAAEVPCTSCPMLPVCGGSCPKLWLEGLEPCPSAKLNIGGRLLLAAAPSSDPKVRAGLVRDMLDESVTRFPLMRAATVHSSPVSIRERS